jgi:hypothetical protein
MNVFGSAFVIFGCFIVVIVLGIYFLSKDNNEAKNITAQHIIYQSIGELGGFSNGEGAMVKTINVLSDSIDNPDIEAIVNCYTNTSATAFRDYLRAVNFSMGQFCKVQQNLETTATATSTSNLNNSDRCTEPKSMIMSVDELKKLGRQYTGDFATDLASCEI